MEEQEKLILNEAQKKTISNIFRDLTKLTVIALVVGQFVPGHKFDVVVFSGGVIVSILMSVVSIIALANIKEAGV